MKFPSTTGTPLYWRLRRLRFGLPIILSLSIILLEIADYLWLPGGLSFLELVSDIVLYGVFAPLLVFLGMNVLTRLIRQRDEAEAQLRVFLQLSRDVAEAPDLESLAQIALGIPERVVGPVATSLIIRDVQTGGRALAGTRNLTEKQRSALAELAMNTASRIVCDECPALTVTRHRDCPSLAALSDGSEAALGVAYCMPLSNIQPPHALLSIYVADEDDIPAEARQILASFAPGLAVALDRIGRGGRDAQVLERVEHAMRAQETWTSTLGHILADIASAYDAKMGAVFLAAYEHPPAPPTAIACWPSEVTFPRLIVAAQEVLQTKSPAIVETAAETGHLTAIPLVTEAQPMGVLVLASLSPYISSQLTLLSVAAGVMAMVIRNGQLYAELETQAVLAERYWLARDMHDGIAQSLGFLNFEVQQIERMLGRDQEAPRRALHEVHAAITDLYAEVRLAIHDLRSPAANGREMIEQLRAYIAAFASRSGLQISFAAAGKLDLSPQAEVQLFRIVQEALTNVRKHAHCRRAWVHLEAGPEAVTLEIGDDGVGFPEATLPQTPEGLGLRIMQERAEAIGGQLRWRSRPGEGVLLEVVVQRATRSHL